MPPPWIVEPVDILECRALCLATYVPAGAPDQLCRDGFEDRLNHGIVVTISLAAHGYSEAMLRKTRLIRARTVLRPAIPMMNAALGRLPQRHGHVQRPDRQVPFHTTADSPANDAPRMQIDDDGQIQPPFAGQDMGSVARPLLVWLLSAKITVQQVCRDIKLMITVRRDLVFAGSNHGYRPNGKDRADLIGERVIEPTDHGRKTLARQSENSAASKMNATLSVSSNILGRMLSLQKTLFMDLPAWG